MIGGYSMKKAFSIFAAALCIVLLTACGGELPVDQTQALRDQQGEYSAQSPLMQADIAIDNGVLYIKTSGLIDYSPIITVRSKDGGAASLQIAGDIGGDLVDANGRKQSIKTDDWTWDVDDDFRNATFSASLNLIDDMSISSPVEQVEVVPYHRNAKITMESLVIDFK